MEVSKKLKVELLYDPAIPFLGIYPKEMKSLSQRDSTLPKHSHVHCSITHNSQNMAIKQEMVKECDIIYKYK